MEIESEDKPRLIKVIRYGSYGLLPIETTKCIFQGNSSCISTSGNSQCGGYMGQEETEEGLFVLCGEETPSEWDQPTIPTPLEDMREVENIMKGKGKKYE